MAAAVAKASAGEGDDAVSGGDGLTAVGVAARISDSLKVSLSLGVPLAEGAAAWAAPTSSPPLIMGVQNRR